MIVLANDGISADAADEMRKHGFEVLTDKVEQDQLVQAINDKGIEVLLVRSATKVREDLINQCPSLKLIGRGGVGMDNIDVEYARSKGIKVINTPAASSQSVAELVMTHLFGLARFTYDSNREMPLNGHSNFKDLKKKYSKGIELRGKTIGIIGFGRIGQSVASYALGIGMKVLAFDAYPAVKEINLHIEGAGDVSVSINPTELNTLLAEADFISIHTPAQADGSAVISEKEFAIMKDGVYIVNASRGGIIDEDALVKALDEGKVASAALDVFNNEPTPNENLLKHSKLSLTPHTGAATVEAQGRVGAELAQQIIETFQTV